MKYCKNKIKKGSADEKKLLDIVKRGAAGGIYEMDNARRELLDLADSLK